MWRIFGYKKQESQPNIDLPNAIIQNKQAIETLEKRQAHLECRIAFQEQDAKRRAQNNDKRGALFALKRKKMFEKELEQLGSAHLTLEQQIITLESAQAQQVAVGALAAGVVAQKVLNQKLNLSKIDDLIEDMQEQSNLQNELAQVLSQDNHLCDDAELLNELHELEAQQLDEALADVGPVPIQSPGRIAAPASRSTTKHVSQSDDPYPLSGNGFSSSISTSGNKKSDEEEQLEKLLQELS